MADTSNPISHLSNRKPKKWAQKAEKRMEEKGTKGSLTRIAASHGESPMTFAREHYNSPGNVGQKSRYAVNINK